MDTRSQRTRPWMTVAFGAALALGTTGGAHAHIDVDQAGSHMSRYGGNAIKEGPCGVTGGQRGSNVYTYAPGETITVTVNEYIGHPGYFRIAFDDDGDDGFMNPQTVDPINRACMPDPSDHCGASDFFNNDTVLMDNVDPHDYPPVGTAPTYTWEVTLPDVECTNCTLQILQVMTDPPGIHAPYDPSYTSDDLYYQCIDLVLQAGTPAGGMDPNGQPMNPDPGTGTGTGTGGTTGSGGTTGQGTAGGGAPVGGTGGATNAGTGGTTGGAQGPGATSGGSDGGGGSSSSCAASPGVGSQHPAGILLLAGLLLLRRRR